MDTKRQWLLMTALGCLAILVVGFMFFVKPQHKKASSLSKQTSQTSADTASLRVQLVALLDNKKQLPAEKAKLAALAVKIPAGIEIPALTRELDSAAKSVSVDLANVAPGIPAAVSVVSTAGSVSAAPAASPIQQVPVAVTVNGDYFKVEKFVQKLETLDRALLVDSFSITPPAGVSTSPAAGAVSVTFQTRVFVAAGGFGSTSAATAGSSVTGSSATSSAQ